MKSETLVFALGGLGEVGKNMYVVMHEDEIIVIDAGVKFPEDSLLGIDYVLADYTFLKQNESKIKALFITHGHEDHIGGISYLISNVNIPVIYAPKVACRLINKKLEDRNINYKNIVEYNKDTKLNFKHFSIEFFGTTHSIPDSFGISITSPNGVVVSTGDFKFDLTPIGPMAELDKMARIGSNGVTLLLSDSTNALHSGFSASESIVDTALGELFARSRSRIIVATFASNIYRLSHIIETCKENNRKVVVFGRSMTNNIEIASECGYIKDKGIIISHEESLKYKPEELCLLCTGSQGESLAALSRIANGTDKNITLMPNDTVIFSSSPIPGNALSINRIINKLYLKGATVYTNSMDADLHTSGHAKSEELKLLLRLLKPNYFMPAHGEYRMLKAHGDLAIKCDIPKENIFILQNGERLAMVDGKVYKKDSILINDIYVDGKRVGDLGASIIKDRKIMSNEGVLAAILNINTTEKKLLLSPMVSTRGFVIVNEKKDLINDIQNKIEIIAENELEKDNFSIIDLKNKIILEINSYVNELTGRRPIILPIILEINN